MFGRGRGGLEQVFLDYCDALALAGHEVLALIHPDAVIRPTLKQRRTSFRALGNLNAWDPMAMLRLRRWVKVWAPDAVIAHGNRAISLLKGAAARPLIGVAANYSLNCAGLDGIFCATEDLVRHCRDRGFVGIPISLIPHMVAAPPEPPPREWRHPPVIGAMGRFVAKKGFRTLIDALQHLATTGVTFRAVIAGDGEEAKTLRALASRRGLDGVVEFPGWQDDKTAFFDRIDVFCLPSLHEPFGIVLLEAMAQALPVIATDSEGPSEIIHDGHDGVIVPSGDPSALAEAIAAVLRNPQAANEIGLNGYRQVRETYNLPALSSRIDAAVRAIAVRSTRHPAEQE